MPYFVTCNEVISPEIFNTKDIIFNIHGSVDRKAVEIACQPISIGKTPTGICIAYAAVASYRDEFKTLLKIIENNIKTREE